MKVVVHIGPMKTGTTYIQYILQNRRKELLQAGWLYPGRLLNQQHACYGICGGEIPWVTEDLAARNEELGNGLIRQIRSRKSNVIVSAEALASLSSVGVGKFLEAIGGADEVVATIRPLEKLLPSAWQQLIKGGSTKTFEEFFNKMIESRNSKTDLWRTYAYGEAVRIWSQFLPVTVVKIGDKGEKDTAWRSFREAANLPEIGSVPIRAKRANTSLNLEAAEILRNVNIILKKDDVERKRREDFSRYFMRSIVYPLDGIPRGTRIKCAQKDLALVERWDNEEMDLIERYASRVIGYEFKDERGSVSEGENCKDSYLSEAALHLIQAWRGSGAGKEKT